MNLNDITKYTFTLYEHSGKEYSKITDIKNSSVVQFLDIPVGEYTLLGEAFSNDNVLLAKNSIFITIKEGENSVPFTLYTNVAYALFNKDNEYDSLYDINIYSTENGRNPIKSNIQVSNYDFDENQNLYAIVKENFIYKLKLFTANSKYYNSLEIELDKDFIINADTKIISSEDGYIYFISYDSDSYEIQVIPYNPKTQEELSFIFITTLLDEYTFWYTPIAISNFYDDENGKTAMLCYPTQFSGSSAEYIKIYSYFIHLKNNEYSCNSEEKITNSLRTDELNLPIIVENEQFNNSKNFILSPMDLRFFNDSLFMTVQTVNTYSICRNFKDPVGTPGTTFNLNFSTGALIKIPLNATKLNFDTDNLKSYGFSNQLTTCIHEAFFTEESEHNGIRYTYTQAPTSQTENKEFYGPGKIVAIKSKKIWIADNGFIYENGIDSTISDQDKQFPSSSQKKRLVVFNLEKETFEQVININETLNNYRIDASSFSSL